MSELNEVYRRALEAARATLGDVAEASGRTYRTLRAYRYGDRRVTPDAARDLATYLRQRSEELAEAAERLEAVADRQGEGSDG